MKVWTTFVSAGAFGAVGLVIGGSCMAATAATSEKDSPGGLEEVVVTAQKRSENLQKSSLAIQSVSDVELVQAGVVQVRDLTALVPGMQIGQGGSATQIFIRGVGDYSASQLANPGVAFNVDGVYVGRPQAVEGNFYDVARIEVLKGPQGTLYGRNSTGGAINVITNQPDLSRGFSGEASLEVASYGATHESGAANIPLSSTVGLRAAFDVVNRDGYLSNGGDDDQHAAARLHFLYAPSDAISLLVSLDYYHVHGIGPNYAIGSYGANPLPGGIDPWTESNSAYGLGSIATVLPLGPLLTLGGMNFVPHIDNTAKNASIKFTADLGWATLTVLPAYRDFRDDERNFPAFSNNQIFTSKEKTLEARLNHDAGATKWVAGGYYYGEDSTGVANINQGIVQATHAAYPVNKTDAYAGFAQVSQSVSDAVRLIGGLRYTSEKHKLNGMISSVNLTPGGPVASVEPFGGDKTFTATTWKAGVEYDLSDDNMLFATVSTGFKSGGINQEPETAPGNNAFQPERLTAYELGSRNRFFDNRLQVNLEIFDWKYKDHQESVITFDTLGAPNFLIVNAGDATVYGASLDVQVKATSNDVLRAYAEYNQGKYSSFQLNPAAFTFNPASTSCPYGPPHPDAAGLPVITVDCSGKALARAPKWTASFGWAHTFPLSGGGQLRSNLTGQYASWRWGAVDFTAQERLPAYLLANAELAYTTARGGLTVAAFVRNLTDEAVATSALQSAFAPPTVVYTLQPPRTYGARLQFKF
jgi:iron complex outermembrane receptor protein